MIDTIWRETAIRKKYQRFDFIQTLSFLSIIFLFTFSTLYRIFLSNCHTMQLFTFHFEIHQEKEFILFFSFFFPFKKRSR